MKVLLPQLKTLVKVVEELQHELDSVTEEQIQIATRLDELKQSTEVMLREASGKMPPGVVLGLSADNYVFMDADNLKP